jgi:outer membrane lipoprotein-sorting protein
MKRILTLLLVMLVPVTLGLAQEEPKKPEAAAQPANEPASLPTLDQILDKFVESSGGKAAIEKVTSRQVKGTFDIPSMGASGTVEIFAKAPNKSYTVIDVPGFGTIQQGYDGTVAWEDNPMTGQRDLTGTELAARKRDVDFYRELHLKEIYPQMVVKGQEKVGERQVYLVEGTPPEGKPEKMFFDVENGQLIRMDAERESPQGTALVETYLEDYRDVDGVKVPFTMRQVNPMFSMTIKFSEVKNNVEIEDSKFSKAKPPEPAAPPKQP